MTVVSAPAGRRERNKQEKLERIVAAASELFAEFGADEVTTQQIADKADIGAGTLFLYAKTKGELLLLVQNAHYADALVRGRAAATTIADRLDAVMAIVQPVVACNRAQIDNGRLYLREIVFGDPDEPRHVEALAIVAETEAAFTEILERPPTASRRDAAALARVVSAVMYLSMAASANIDTGVEDTLADIRRQLAAVFGR